MIFLGRVFYYDDILKYKKCNDVKAEDVELVHDIAYGDNVVEKGDLYFDRRVKGKLPLVINIHGGGWIVGDKKFRKGFSLLLARESLAVFNINYGLAPQYRYPDCVKHVYDAIKWAFEHAEEYRFDTQKIFLSGDSSGAHLASLAAATLRNTEFQTRLKIETGDFRLAGVLLYCGPYNLETMLDKPFASSVFSEVSGGHPLRDIESYEYRDELSPINFVREDFPKAFLVMGKNDLICGGQTEELIKKLNEKNVKYELFYAKGALNSQHCFHLYYKRKNARRCIARSIKFIKETAGSNHGE